MKSGTIKRWLQCLGVALGALGLAGCAGLPTKGRVAGGRYQSPMNNFSIALPALSDAQVEDRVEPEVNPIGGSVIFRAATGEFWLVDYMRLPEGFAARLNTPDKQDEAHRRYLARYALSGVDGASPQSAVVKEEALEADGARAYFAVINIPEGSRLIDGKTNRRLDSVRGLLVFDRDGYMYMLGCEMNFAGHRVDAAELTDEQVKDAQATLELMKGNMAFP